MLGHFEDRVLTAGSADHRDVLALELMASERLRERGVGGRGEEEGGGEGRRGEGEDTCEALDTGFKRL
jgi:hypothetical protein